MPNVNITVRNKIATGDGTKIVCGNSDYIAVFNFDEEWNEYPTKTMRVEYGNSYTDVVFSGNSAEIPVVQNVFGIKIGVYAGSLRTTTPAYFDSKKSILCDSGMPVQPTPSVYEQIITLLNSKANENQGAENAGKYWRVAEDGSLVFAAGSGGTAEIFMRVSGGYIQYSTDNETWQNVIAVADLKGADGRDGTDGRDGVDGYTPVKGVDYFDGVDGTNGTDGRDGVDGYTPQKGIDYFDGVDGENGQDGADGQDGYTPVRGTDYWTAADIATIKGYVDDAILNGEW